jgi:6-phosphofructokinase 2
MDRSLSTWVYIDKEFLPMIPTLTMNPCLDVSGDIDKLISDRKLRCSNVRREPGGGGLNVSRVVVTLGCKSLAVFPAGQAGGKVVEKMLREEGVDCETISHQGYFRQSFAVQDIGEGRIYRFALPGPDLDESTWQTCLSTLDELDPPDWMVLSGSLPPGVPEDIYGQIAHRFRDQPTRIILDTSGEPFAQALQHRLFLIKPNRRELEDFCGSSLADEAEQERVCRELIDRHDLQAVALTLGSDGALLTTADSQFRIRGLKVEIRSPVGAGDSFVGAMALALGSGKSLRQAFLYGMAAGTAALITPGSELCRKADTEKYYQKLSKLHGRGA